MAAQKFKLIFVFLVSSCAQAYDPIVIKISNQLLACSSVTNIETSQEGAIPVFSFDLVVDKPIAECGCKSALGSYAVYSLAEGYKSYLIGGKVGFVASAHKYLPLAAEQNLIKNRALLVEFSCAQPD